MPDKWVTNSAKFVLTLVLVYGWNVKILIGVDKGDFSLLGLLDLIQIYLCDG